jgi:hypothetical protein
VGWPARPELLTGKAGVRPSMGSVGDAYDNAMCESFFATLECELLDRCRFNTQAEARHAVFAFIEGFYNPRRRHSSIGYLSPLDYERQHCARAADPNAHQPACRSRPSRTKPCGRPQNAAVAHRALPISAEAAARRGIAT